MRRWKGSITITVSTEVYASREAVALRLLEEDLGRVLIPARILSAGFDITYHAGKPSLAEVDTALHSGDEPDPICEHCGAVKEDER